MPIHLNRNPVIEIVQVHVDLCNITVTIHSEKLRHAWKLIRPVGGFSFTCVFIGSWDSPDCPHLSHPHHQKTADSLSEVMKIQSLTFTHETKSPFETEAFDPPSALHLSTPLWSYQTFSVHMLILLIHCDSYWCCGTVYPFWRQSLFFTGYIMCTLNSYHTLLLTPFPYFLYSYLITLRLLCLCISWHFHISIHIYPYTLCLNIQN